MFREEVEKGLEKIFEGLGKHAKLEECLNIQYADIYDFHHIKTNSSSPPPERNSSEIYEEGCKVLEENIKLEETEEYYVNNEIFDNIENDFESSSDIKDEVEETPILITDVFSNLVKVETHVEENENDKDNKEEKLEKQHNKVNEGNFLLLYLFV